MHDDALQITRDDRQLLVVLRGSWSRDTAHLDPDTLLADIGSFSTLKIDASEVDDWDSTLVQAAIALRARANAQGLELLEDWPPGVSNLLALAVAVPGARPEDQQGGHSRATLWSRLDPRVASRAVGSEVANLAEFVGALVLSGLGLVTGTGRGRFRDFLHFCYQTGPNALPIISLTSFLVGLILGYLGAVQLKQFGAEIYVADLVTVGVLREMGPLMTAIILAGRTGAAYAAQLGTMRVNEEVDAIEILGVSPMEFLVLPRVTAIIVMTPLLTLFANVLGILGGGLVSSGLGVTPLQYWSEVQVALYPSHLVVGLVKAVLFGALVGIAGCRAGLNSGRNSEGVGKATTEAVVVAMVYLIIADALVNITCQLLDI